ncbi:helix-turn-helix domain-containing protein [Phyllobacterium sp. A18/5-2]|nr:helix-turn-helix domain-containing protein [Phyllobacterium sp. A18/5-2]UXN64677.1 helix-turn-helix domain-containing protein [Phyllobacterium sp. A18/5-2]
MRQFRHPPTSEIQLESVLYALSDPVRLSIVRKLALEGEATCAALDGGRPKSSMSHHFRVLRRVRHCKNPQRRYFPYERVTQERSGRGIPRPADSCTRRTKLNVWRNGLLIPDCSA